MNNVTKRMPFQNPVGMNDPANPSKHPVNPLAATALNGKRTWTPQKQRQP